MSVFSFIQNELGGLAKEAPQVMSDTGNFVKAIFSPVQGAVNAVRALPSLAYGAIGSVTPGHTFQGNVQSFNNVVPAASFSDQGTRALAQRRIIPSGVGNTVNQAGQLAGSLALPAPGIGKIGAFERLSSPVSKLGAYTAVRAAEGAAYGGLNGLSQNGDINQAIQGAKQGALFGAAGNVLLSPRLSIAAGKQIGKPVSRMTDVANQPNIAQAVNTLHADPKAPLVVNGQPVMVNGKQAMRTVETVPLTVNEPTARGILAKGGVDPKSVPVNHYGSSADPKVTLRLDPNTGQVLSWAPQRSQFAERFVNSPYAPKNEFANALNAGKVAKPASPDWQPNMANARFRSKASDSFDPQAYVAEQTAAQNAARGEKGSVGKVADALAGMKAQLVDKTAPIEDLLYKAQKQGGYEVLPRNNVSYQIDRVLRAPTLAGQFAKDNGLADVIRQAPDLNSLDQYMVAKHAAQVESNGIATGRDLGKDAQLVRALGSQYEPLAQKVSQYSKKLLDYAAQTGLVSKETAATLRQKYPDYVPLNRIFSEEENGLMQPSPGSTRRGIASQGSQSVVKSLKGSDRQIESPIQSLLAKTNDAFQQGERNVAAQQLVSYKDLPGNPLELRKLSDSENSTGKSTVSAMIDGRKVTYETNPAIASAAKNLDQQQLGLLGKIINAPVRLLRVGATGLNPAFTLANLAKDQVSAFINSDHALQTSVVNPPNFLKALWGSLGHGELYQELVRSGAHGTSFDIGRDQVRSTVGQIRSGRNLASSAAYTVTHPGELFRAAENIIGRTEDLTRTQVYKGTYDSLIKEGRTVEDAKILAASQARNATTNFARSGSWGKVLNSTIPYLNAGIQGSRTLVRGLAQRPVQTTAKIAATVLFPTATVVAWNLADPQRKAAWDDIQQFEKQGNLIIIPPNPTKDANGKWNVIKIPFSQEVANLGYLVGRGMEAAQGGNPVGFGEMANGLISTGTSIDTSSGRSLLSQVTPQAIKPFLESETNQNLFTGNKIVPDSQKNLPPDMQVGGNTSGTARLIGGKLGVSPRIVDNFIGTSVGGLGKILVNGSDNALAASGAIPRSQAVGGQDIGSAVTSRFNKASGGVQLDNAYKAVADFSSAKSAQSARNVQSLMEAMRSGDPSQVTRVSLTIPQSARAADIQSAQNKLGTARLPGVAAALTSLSSTQLREFVQANPQYASAAANLPNSVFGSVPASTSITGKSPITGGKSGFSGAKIPGQRLGRSRSSRPARLAKAITVPKPAKTKSITVPNGTKLPGIKRIAAPKSSFRPRKLGLGAKPGTRSLRSLRRKA